MSSQRQYVNATRVTLTNVTDGDTYNQLTNLAFDLNRAAHFRSRTDGNIDRFFGNANNGIEFDLKLDASEVADWLALATLSGGSLPDKEWRVRMTSVSNLVTDLILFGQVTSFRTIRPGIGASEHHIRIEASTITVSQ